MVLIETPKPILIIGYGNIDCTVARNDEALSVGPGVANRNA